MYETNAQNKTLSDHNVPGNVIKADFELDETCFWCCGCVYCTQIVAILCNAGITQVDYAMDVFKQLYPDSPDPEGNNNNKQTTTATATVFLLSLICRAC